jgi:hypothetical protein
MILQTVFIRVQGLTSTYEVKQTEGSSCDGESLSALRVNYTAA